MGTLPTPRRQTMHTLTLTLSLSLTLLLLLPRSEASVKECLQCSSTDDGTEKKPDFDKECAEGTVKGKTCQDKNAVGCIVSHSKGSTKDKGKPEVVNRACCSEDTCTEASREDKDGTTMYATSCYSDNCNTMDAGSMAILPSLSLLVTGILMVSYNRV